MNKHIVHIVLVVLSILAGVYGLYLGLGQPHAYPQGSYYLQLSILLALATMVNLKP